MDVWGRVDGDGLLCTREKFYAGHPHLMHASCASCALHVDIHHIHHIHNIQ